MTDPMPRQDLSQPPRMPEAAEIAALRAERDTLRAKLAEAVEAMKCARAIFDTPISRRRLGLDANDDERLQVFRATLARMEADHG